MLSGMLLSAAALADPMPSGGAAAAPTGGAVTPPGAPPAGTPPANPAPAAAAAPGEPPAASDSGAAPAGQAPGSAPGAAAAGTAPAGEGSSGEFKTLDQEVQGLKKDVIDLNKDLFVLEEELLFPANTQVALYVSMDVGSFFALDSVTVKIDNREVKNYLYTAREADALLKGGVQQIYLGNLKVGKHELVAFFTGKGPVERNYRRGATINFEKGVGAKYLELKITDKVPKHQPEFTIKDWE